MPAPRSGLDASVVARLATGEREARRLLDVLAESFDTSQVALGAAAQADGHWTVSLHFRAAPNQAAVRALVALAADAETANAFVFETVAAKDWVRASLAGLAPVEAGRFVVHGAHDRGRVPANRIGIEIEAALAFGTGHHGTTRGCLLAFDRIARPASRGRGVGILDVGTGSGVLAIAAARAWHLPVLATDIDLRAVRAARHNARRNRVGGMVEVLHIGSLEVARLRRRAPFDLVFANILLEPLKLLARPIVRVTRRTGRIVLSGLLDTQASAALAAYRAQGFALERRLSLDGWATLVLRRRGRRSVAARARGP